MSFILTLVKAALVKATASSIVDGVAATVTNFQDDVAGVLVSDEPSPAVNLPVVIGATAIAAVAATLIIRKL